MSNESQQHIPKRTGLDVLSGAEFTEIQESMGNMNPSDSMSFDLNSIFPYSEASSTHSTEAILYDTDQSVHQHVFSNPTIGYEQPQEPESIGKLSNWSEDAVEVLKKWLKQNCRHPYPTKQEKAELAEQTELTVTQVSTWFAYARRRGRHASADRCLTSTSLSCPDKPRKVSDEQWPSFSPLDRWRNSPPEVEAASLEAIRSAVARSGTSYLPTGDLQHQSPPEDNDARSLCTGIEPFSASWLAAKDARGAEPTDQRTSTASKPTPFEYLTARLTGFVNGIQAAGGTVSDELLQKEARCIIFFRTDVERMDELGMA
ncbi:hypothetical protein CIHG_02524 [Coccidioides immitis H538.4]|uniref:Homeobox domain-containing protein n=1 Tax=Coccidioides immitis H538.4 TaxID=396776 RepID=A0A0J8RHY2_COCIT|nr:hypothetical protein CIHG_02524 [Coccidioides immitis H538.4]